jgi:coenzyme F420 hydrogenase subunit beta
MGYLKAEHNDRRLVKIYYRDYYHSIRSFFKPKRCLSCVDHYGELADLCFGDIQVGEYKNDDIGVNSLVVRNTKFDNLLKEASQSGELKIDQISKDIVNESQKTMLRHKRKISKIVMDLDKVFGRKVPICDVEFENGASLKDYISVFIIKLQLVVGRHKLLWFIIDKLKDSKHS